MLRRVEGRTACIPTCDIQLMWKCHQTAPAGYVHDTQLFLGNRSDDESAIQQQLSNTTRQDFEQTSRTWELLFGRPYERAGAVWSEVSNVDETMPLDPLLKRIPLTINWHHQSFDLNARHGFLQPRYVLEVCVHIKSAARREQSQKRADQLFLRMQMVDACRNFKHHVSVEKYRHDTVWHKLWSMQCEASTKGIVVDLIANVSACLVAPIFSKKVLGQVTVSWNELEKEPLLESAKSLTMKKSSHVSDTLVVLTSITPPVQAPYLLKALLDRVTDNTGAMISKKVLRLNKNEPQEGRWITRTVLDHAGRECFIIRMRFATGVWRRKIEGPVGVDWNERIIHIHGGGWNYISGSTGIAPEQVLATATPLDDEREQYKMKWSFSTGETLTIQMPIENLEWERHLRFSLKGNRLGVIRLLNGRHMQYEVPSSVPEEEEGFVTLVRYTAEARQGRAMALFNWKLLAMEVLPEEDVVLVLLICIATQRAVADLGAKTLRNLYRRKHVKKAERQRNWGSVVMGGGQEVPSELMFWYVNPEEVLGVDEAEMDNEEVLPKGASEHMYRGTSWLYTGSMKGLYKMSSKGSCESFTYETGDHHQSLARFGSQTKVPVAASR
ncbi:hypothetical protein GOP47_0021126 [Adiantum capillus-veneris]|uniref:GRPD C-terminal domain-containing protein n=1 Tax=Adiantum capillus-veneris TaxID=13818 RepID=A0A9D4UCC5_ADICA|nr:hypothetical protein GOP47_0021126 [Adiantum capillus-veneris]